MLDDPVIPVSPQHERSAAEIVVPDMERDDRGIPEGLDADVLRLEADLRGSGGPYLPQNLGECL